MTISAPIAQPAPLHDVRALPSDVSHYYGLHLLGGLFPLTAGLLLYGWRAACAVFLVESGTISGLLLWRRIGPRGPQLSLAQGLWYALLLSLMLPAHLATSVPDSYGETEWPLLIAAGFVLAIFLWLLGGIGAGRIHPVLVTYLLLTALFLDLLVPHWVLERNHLLVGDLLYGRALDARLVRREPWINRPKTRGLHSESADPAAEALSRYTSGREKPARGYLPLQGLLRDSLPPLEDLIVAGHPGPIGTSSAIAVIIGGLFLLYRGLIDFRIPLFFILAEFALLLVLPTPAAVQTHTQWHWIVSRRSEIGWGAGITLVNYELMAAPCLFVAFFLATAPSMRPISGRARMIFAIVAGALAAVMQMYVAVSYGPYLALLLASLLTPVLDAWIRPRSRV